MSKLRGRALLPSKFVFRHALPAFLASPRHWRMAPQQLRKYFEVMNPEKDVGVSQIAFRCNEVCNLRCSTCGQWGENGWILEKLNRGERLDSLSWETTRRIVYETLHDRPLYYVWGAEPSIWKPLVPLFEELGKNNLLGTIVSTCHALE